MASALACVRHAGQFQRQHDVFQRRQVRQQLEGLEHKAQLFLAQRGAAVFIQCINVYTIQHYLAGARRVQPRQQAQQSRLAGAGGANDCQRLGLLHGKIHLVQNGQFAAGIGHALGQATDCNGRMDGHPPSPVPPTPGRPA
jgi:hypothetical protein